MLAPRVVIAVVIPVVFIALVSFVQQHQSDRNVRNDVHIPVKCKEQ